MTQCVVNVTGDAGLEIREWNMNYRYLQRRFGRVTAVYIFTIFVFFALFRWRWPCCAERWLALTAVVAVYSLWLVWRHLPENRREGETAVLPRFGWGNRLTLLRGLAISMVAGFLLSPWPPGWLGWLPAILYTIADVADYLDGYAARKTNHATRLGERLDMEFDGLGMVVVTLLAVWYAQLPWWYLLIGLARLFFLFGLWLRRKLDRPEYPLIFSWHRRIFAGFQMGFMSVVLWPIVPAAGATIAGTLFALATSASFLRDWFLVIGWLDPKKISYQIWQQRIYRLTAIILPPFLRLVLLLAVLNLVGQMMLPVRPLAWTELFAGWGLPFPQVLAIAWAGLGILASLLVVLGAMGRLASLVLLFPLGFDIAARGLTVTNGLALTCTLAVLMLGTGALSLWQPEETFMVRRAGEMDG